jgi:tetrahydromethanopterin S-methyltransferase subunit E
MIFIPTWTSNFLLLGVCWLSGYQLVQLRRANPIPTIQFGMIVFCLLVVTIITLKNKHNPWLSLVFFLIGVTCLLVMLRQHRMLPPRRRLE